MKYVWVIILLMSLSCKNKETEFTQPKILEKNSKFDLTKITFKEDVHTLLSQSLDTVNKQYPYEDSSYPTTAQLNATKANQRTTILNKKRHRFKSFTRDSIGQFFGVYASEIEIETDSNLNVKTYWATAKVFDSIELNAALHKIYLTYGKTNWMKAYEAELGLKEVIHSRTDENGNVNHQTTYKAFDIDYESYLYEYDIASEYYQQWNLSDRMVQIHITKGREYRTDPISNEYVHQSYYNLEYISIHKSEFDLIKNHLITRSTKNNYPMQIIKPYYLYELDFYVNFNKFYLGEKDGEKIYDFNK